MLLRGTVGVLISVQKIKIPYRYLVWLVISFVCVIPPLGAVEEPLSAVELTRLILDGDSRDFSNSDSVEIDQEFSHYDSLGFPETADGRLVVQSETYGLATRLQGENTPFLLYARYSNSQRDAVLFARTAQISDPLPNGNFSGIPFGFGAIRMNEVEISIVEGIIVPHISDNQKKYIMFPLFDLYASLTAGTEGIGVGLRGVLQERYTAQLGASVSTVRYFNNNQLRRTPVGSFSAGGGIRFPGLLPESIGPNLITVGGDILLEVKGDNLGGGVGVLPGAFVELERVFFDGVPVGRDYRVDPRPFNYRVHTVFARLTGRIDPAGLRVGDPFRVAISIGYRVNIIGPKIPEHDFKRTKIDYVAEEYLEDLQRQIERRESRSGLETN